MTEHQSTRNESRQASKGKLSNHRFKVSPVLMDSKLSSYRERRSDLFRKVPQKVSFNFLARFLRELNIKMVNLEEKKPTKFSTTSWVENQAPYAVYRAILLVHVVAILIWGFISESNSSNFEKWILSLPTWNFLLYCFYQCLMMTFVSFQFFADCLCNDDYRWYHMICWVVQSAVFNSALLCLLGSLANALSYASNNLETISVTEILTSDNVNFTYVIGCLMIIDVMITNVTVHILHFVYPFVFYLGYFAFNLYRWGAGYAPVYVVLDYGSHTSLSVGFLLIVILLLCPFLQIVAYSIDTLRYFLLINCIERHRKRFIEVSNAAEGFVTYNRGVSGRFQRFSHSERSHLTSLSYNVVRKTRHAR